MSASLMVEMETSGMTAGATAARALPALSAGLSLAAGGALGRAAGWWGFRVLWRCQLVTAVVVAVLGVCWLFFVFFLHVERGVLFQWPSLS